MKHKSSGRFSKIWGICFLILIFIGLAGTILTIRYAKQSERELKSLSFDWEIDSPENEELYVLASAGSQWMDQGKVITQYDIVLVNESPYPIHDWRVTINVADDSLIDSSWNGFWSHAGDKIFYEPAEFNNNVAPGERKSFGLVMVSAEAFTMNEVTLDYYESRELKRYAVFWVFIGIISAAAIAFIFVEVVNAKISNYAKTHAAYKDLVSESLRTIANIIDTKDEYTKGHSVRVAIYSRMIAERMGMNEHDQERIYYIGLLHDIGKVGIPASILTKPGRLNDEEFEIIKRHPSMGAQIMKDFSSIPGVQNGIKYHHERYDGKGYNEGLKGEEIPLEGRIICVADSYDAMSSKRCYRNSLSYDFILDELKRNSGTQFDPDILVHMVALVEEGYAPISDAEMEDYEI